MGEKSLKSEKKFDKDCSSKFRSSYSSNLLEQSLVVNEQKNQVCSF